MNSCVSSRVYGSPETAQPVGRLICGHPEANGDLLSQTRDSFEPSCSAVVKCSSDRPVLALSVQCVAVVRPPSPLHPCWPLKLTPVNLQGLEGEVQPAGYKLLLQIEPQIRLGTTPSLLSCQWTPWLGKSLGGRLLAPGRSHCHCVLAMFLGSFPKYFVLTTAGENTLDQMDHWCAPGVASLRCLQSPKLACNKTG